MPEENPPPYSLLCSGCYTPCSGPDAHVVPRWHAEVGRILTTYRCANCWHQAIDDSRMAVRSGDPTVRNSFCDFLVLHGYQRDAATLRAAPPLQQERQLLAILDALQAGQILFDP